VSKKGVFTKDVLKVAGGTASSQVIAFFTVPLLTRIYLPETFGIVAVFTSFVTILTAITCLRYENAIMLPEKDEEAVNVLSLGIIIAGFFTLFVSLLVFFVGKPMAVLLGVPTIAPYLWLVPIGVFFSGIFRVLVLWNSRIRLFGSVSIAQITNTTITRIYQLVLGVIRGSQSSTLIVGQVFGPFLISGILVIQVWRKWGGFFQEHVRLKHIIVQLKRYKKFPLIDTWGILLNNISIQMPVFMLSWFFSQVVVGYYSQGYRLLQVPLLLIAQSVSQVFFQRASVARSTEGELKNVFEQVFEGLIAIGLGPTLIVMIVGQDVISVLLGSNWGEAGLYLQILVPWIFVVLISSPLSTVFTVLERQELLVFFHIVILLSRVISLAIGGFLQNIYLTLILFSVTGVLVYGGLVVWNIILSGSSIYKTYCILLHYGRYSIPIAFLLFLLTLLIQNPYIITFLSGICLVIYYFALLRWEPFLTSIVFSFVPVRYHPFIQRTLKRSN
jgi:O-antigen/teichoic acid export membrane protein